ncbi:MAG: anaerobic ribonucleoside-triphosphate reductase activating protein [Candidatus Thiodiazotropha sp. (ex Dulcina madagascariensis)]|nr:anaerobic ribonucleoside-triphosphate reductase activating protein [Candidatus Thiodiazotropha sp. (ex Dulcina madagascariensis)]MCU7927002.1 anaerobic ribonucleoside-triphosphate reductase activating protein [Candidatus Thiodiazotropha sp. (ex Dulcina madagascariensis)]
MPRPALQVGGLTPATTLDYPGRLSAVVFCQGCPLSCRYCHNADLLPRRGRSMTPWPEILKFLKSRQGLLEAVVFSGGEPTLQRALPDAIAEVRAMGFLIGLHTAGIYPKRLARILPDLDWVGLDIKALPDDYEALTGVAGSGIPAWQSLRLLIGSGLSHQIRTTWHGSFMPREKRERLLDALTSLGSVNHVWQPCRTDPYIDEWLDGRQPESSE